MAPSKTIFVGRSSSHHCSSSPIPSFIRIAYFRLFRRAGCPPHASRTPSLPLADQKCEFLSQKDDFFPSRRPVFAVSCVLLLICLASNLSHFIADSPSFDFGPFTAISDRFYQHRVRRRASLMNFYPLAAPFLLFQLSLYSSIFFQNSPLSLQTPPASI